MFAVVEVNAAGALLRIVGLFDEPLAVVEQYAAQKCANDWERHVRRFRVEEAGRPCRLEAADGSEFADGVSRLVPVL